MTLRSRILYTVLGWIPQPPPEYVTKSIAAMTTEKIKEIQTRIGTTVDGQWGPKSTEACKAHLRKLMPNPSPWPSPDDLSMARFYGKAGDESNLVNLSIVGLGLLYEGKPVKTIRVHRKCSESLHRVLTAIAASPHAWVLMEYAGCFNFRPMRGGSRLSKHAWGAAIDLVPARNGLVTGWPAFANMPIEVMEFFAAEGAMAAGAFWQRDAMHFEFTSSF